MLAVALVAAHLLFHATNLPPGAVLRLGDDRFRAGAPVRHLSFSDDGRTLHGWVNGPLAKLQPVAWDAATGIPVPLPVDPVPPDLPFNAAQAVHIGGTRVLTAGPGNAARVWYAQAGREVVQRLGHTTHVTAVAASPDGKRLAPGDANGLVRVWDATTFRPLSEPHGHTGPVRAIRVSADGSRAVTTGDDHTARVWDLTTGRHLRAFATTGQVELDARGASVIIPAGGTTMVRDVVTGLEVVAPERTILPAPGLPNWLAGLGLAVSTDGRMVAVAGPGSMGELREAATGEVRRGLAGHRGSVRVLGFTPDGTRLLTT